MSAAAINNWNILYRVCSLGKYFEIWYFFGNGRIHYNGIFAEKDLFWKFRESLFSEDSTNYTFERQFFLSKIRKILEKLKLNQVLTFHENLTAAFFRDTSGGIPLQRHAHTDTDTATFSPAMITLRKTHTHTCTGIVFQVSNTIMFPFYKTGQGLGTAWKNIGRHTSKEELTGNLGVWL